MKNGLLPVLLLCISDVSVYSLIHLLTLSKNQSGEFESFFADSTYFNIIKIFFTRDS